MEMGKINGAISAYQTALFEPRVPGTAAGRLFKPRRGKAAGFRVCVDSLEAAAAR